MVGISFLMQFMGLIDPPLRAKIRSLNSPRDKSFSTSRYISMRLSMASI